MKRQGNHALKFPYLRQALYLGAFFWTLLVPEAFGLGFEVFGKGSFAKSTLEPGVYNIQLSGTAGFAISLDTQLRLEFRYTEIGSYQNSLTVNGSTTTGALSNWSMNTSMYSFGMHIDFFGPQAVLEPYIYLGAGYVNETQTYGFVPTGSTSMYQTTVPTESGVSANVGAGFQLRVMHFFALECELYSYAVGVTEPNPILNYLATVGGRIFF